MDWKHWLYDNWLMVGLVAVGVLSALSRATVHRSEIEGAWWRKALLIAPLFLIEVLSVLRSRGSSVLTKLPLTIEGAPRKSIFSEPPRAKRDTIGKGGAAVALLFLVASCSSWQAPALKTTNTVRLGVSAAHEGLKVLCKPQVRLCKREGRLNLKACPELRECSERRAPVILALDVTMRSVMITLLALEVKDKAAALSALASSTKEWAQLISDLEALGIDVSKWRL